MTATCAHCGVTIEAETFGGATFSWCNPDRVDLDQPARDCESGDHAGEAHKPANTIQTYTVEVANTERNEGFTVELIATSERAAISRARGTLFHRYQDVSFMDPSCAYAVTGVEPFVPQAVSA